MLVPANAANAALGAEVGPGWVLQYEGDLGPDDLVAALEVAGSEGRSPSPDLSRRDWPAAGVAHANAYREALAAFGRR